tara:strand:- start:1318 stop:1614 length:297 start_codon:yes stop_codon:yes gene_type:complete
MFKNKNNKKGETMSNVNQGLVKMFKTINKISNEHQKHLDKLNNKHQSIVELEVLFRELQDSDNSYDIFYEICTALDMKQLKFIKSETKKLIKEEKKNN